MLCGIVLDCACLGAWPRLGVGTLHVVNCNEEHLGNEDTSEGPKRSEMQAVEQDQGACMQHNCICASQRP